MQPFDAGNWLEWNHGIPMLGTILSVSYFRLCLDRTSVSKITVMLIRATILLTECTAR